MTAVPGGGGAAVVGDPEHHRGEGGGVVVEPRLEALVGVAQGDRAAGGGHQQADLGGAGRGKEQQVERGALARWWPVEHVEDRAGGERGRVGRGILGVGVDPGRASDLHLQAAGRVGQPEHRVQADGQRRVAPGHHRQRAADAARGGGQAALHPGDGVVGGHLDPGEEGARVLRERPVVVGGVAVGEGILPPRRAAPVRRQVAAGVPKGTQGQSPARPAISPGCRSPSGVPTQGRGGGAAPGGHRAGAGRGRGAWRPWGAGWRRPRASRV